MYSKAPRHINLHLPLSWNHCSTEELESIATAIIQEQQRVNRYHPFDWQRVKLSVVLAINDITVLRNNKITTDGEWLVQRKQDKEPWPLNVGQILYLTERLAWLDDEKSDKTVFMFPYQEIEVQGFKGSRVKVQGPPPLLDGYTWREYRWLTDWMQEYMRLSNEGRDASTAQREFLAVLFKPAMESLNNDVTKLRDNIVQAAAFADLSPVKWQVILFWWSSLLRQLAKKFPRVFKSQPVGKKRSVPKADTPWDFYNRVTATIQKYIGGISAQDVDNQPYGVTLQQLEMIADEAAEMEKLKHK